MKSTHPRARPTILTLVAACCLFAAVSATAFPATTPDAARDVDEHVIPSEQCRGLWLVSIVYRDGPEGSLRLLLDTGAARTAVDPDAVERVFRRRFAPGKSVTLKDGAAGPLKLHRLKVIVHDMDHLARALGRPIDGILGFPTFEKLLLTLDYPTGEVRVATGKLPRPDGETVFRDVGETRPYLALAVGGRKEPVLVDSGSVNGFRLHSDDRLRWRVVPRPISASTGYDEIRVNRTGRAVETIVVGPLAAATPIVRIWDDTRLIGHQVMRRFAWTFDQRKRRIRMVPDSFEPIVTGPERGIGVALKPIAAGFEVARVFPDTPAAAVDLAPGDVVVAIDGIPFDERDCAIGFQPETSDSVVLTVRRDGGHRAVAVDVVDLVP